jgi:hypothetical protein
VSSSKTDSRRLLLLRDVMGRQAAVHVGRCPLQHTTQVVHVLLPPHAAGVVRSCSTPLVVVLTREMLHKPYATWRPVHALTAPRVPPLLLLLLPPLCRPTMMLLS